MLSKIGVLPRLGASLVRGLNTSNRLLVKQTLIIDKNITPESNKKVKETKILKSPVSKKGDALSDLSNVKENKFYKSDTIVAQVSSDSLQLYEKLIAKLKENLNSIDELIKTCEELNSLAKIEKRLTNEFVKEAVNAQVSKKLCSAVSSGLNNNESLLIIAMYLARFDPTRFGQIEAHFKAVIPSLNVEQLLAVMSIAKLVKVHLDSDILGIIRTKIETIQTFKSLLEAAQIFYNDKYVMKVLDEKILQIGDTLTTENWVTLLNTHSILKHRNLKVIESCAYNLNGKKLQTDDIYKCLLSCGILGYHFDKQFLKFIMHRFNEIIDENIADREWLETNTISLFSIISSIGMLQLRDKTCLNKLSELLATNCENKRVLINFIITCGSLNYDPHGFEKIVSKIKLNDFNKRMDMREQMFLLNYVWSLCMLNKADGEFIKAVLDKEFSEPLIGKDIANNKFLRSILVKLLNINLYTQIFVDEYKGPLLPNSITAGKYSTALKLDSTPLNASFISTLSSYRSPEKYFKSNMLTPFGILIDALLVIDSKGNPLPIADYFSKTGQLETSDKNEKKIAFKLVEAKDFMSVFGNKLSGNLSMQTLLLKELGYTVITMTQDELLATNIIQRVDLIKKKLSKAALSDE